MKLQPDNIRRGLLRAHYRLFFMIVGIFPLTAPISALGIVGNQASAPSERESADWKGHVFSNIQGFSMSSLASVPAVFAAFHLLVSVVPGCRVHASWKPLTVTNMKRILQSRRSGFGTAPLVPFILSLSNVDSRWMRFWGVSLSFTLTWWSPHHTTASHNRTPITSGD